MWPHFMQSDHTPFNPSLVLFKKKKNLFHILKTHTGQVRG